MGEEYSQSKLGKCFLCGKDFFMPVQSEWAYRINPNKNARDKTNGKNTTRFFCSWGCLRKYEKQEEAEEIAKYGRKMRHSVKHG